MDVRKVLLVKSSTELLTILASLSYSNKHGPQYPRGRDQNEYKCTILRSYNIRSTFYTESTYLNYFVNWKIK